MIVCAWGVVMIVIKISHKQKSLIFVCIALSILLHIVLIIVNIIFNPSIPTAIKKTFPSKKQAPMTMLKQPPPRRLHRAGTDKQAPKTTKPLAPTQQPAGQPPIVPPQSRPVQPPQEQPKKEAPKPKAKKTEQKIEPKKEKRTPTTQASKRGIQKFFQDAIDKEAASQERSESKNSLHFLSPQHLYEAMRKNATQEQPGATQQFGELKYLHYNQKVYQALQQSMNLVVSRLSRDRYTMALDKIQHPTRIRFALNKDGKLIGVSIVLSSGNVQYDAVAQRIVQEGSYPPIPKSFNMHTTYHTYGIVLYYDGAPRDQIGVSPYLEGE